MLLQIELLDLRKVIKEKCEELIADKELASELYLKLAGIEDDPHFREPKKIPKWADQVIEDFERGVNKAHGEGWDFVDLFTEDGARILTLLKMLKEWKPDCEHAEHDGRGCLGYSGCSQDDEPCCMNCRRRYVLEKMDYSHGGCEHSKPDGFICMAFANERTANWMVGLAVEKDYCECWEALK